MSETRADEAAPPDRRRVFLTGTFDVQNYGDLLFPPIAAKRLEPYGIDVIPVSPTDHRTGWRDTAACIAFDDVLAASHPVSGILVGGGNIVHVGPAKLVDYNAASPATAYARLWLGATIAATIRNVPLIWNAPGVPYPFPAPLAGHVVIRQALEAANYVSVRDRTSADNLGDPGNAVVDVVPDTAVDVARLWPRRRLETTFARLLDRKGAAGDNRFVTLHLKARSFAEPVEMVAAWIDAFAAGHGLTPVLLALGPCHHDDVAARRIGRALRGPKIVVDDAHGIEEIAAAIAMATLHLGSSLHGYITSAAYDVPSLLVGRPALPKFAGFLEHIGRSGDLVGDWQAAFAVAPARLAEPRRGPLVPDDVHRRLDAHWDRVRTELAAPRSNMLQQALFLRSYVQRGIGLSGWGWMFSPPLDR